LAINWKIPSVYITNLIRPSFGFATFLSPGERIIEQYVKKADKIVIPDNKPPYTVCEYNLGNVRDVGVEPKTEYVGSFLDTQPTALSEQHIFAPVSGPYGTRCKLLRMIVPVLKKLPIKSIVSMGEPGEYKKRTVGNCELHSWLTPEERHDAMRNASIVLFSGGHITCFETIKYCKPSICIPTQAEQLANGAKLQALHCSLLAKNSAQLEKAIYKMLQELKQAQQNMETLHRVTNTFNGLDRATQIVEETGRSI
jgi:UDP:flavonoid glycosyltransferase YjiC (YdhE family)